MDTPGLRAYLDVKTWYDAAAIRGASPRDLDAISDRLDLAWYALTPEERAWLDTREGA